MLWFEYLFGCGMPQKDHVLKVGSPKSNVNDCKRTEI